MQTWQFLYFLFNKYIKFKNGRFETRRFETWRFVNLTFCKPDVLKPDVLKPDVLKPDVLWVAAMSIRIADGNFLFKPHVNLFI
jgi:hypothetical protein